MTIMGRVDKLNLVYIVVYILICFDFPDTNRPKPQSIITAIFDITHIKRLEVAYWQLCIYNSDEINCTSVLQNCRIMGNNTIIIITVNEWPSTTKVVPSWI